MSPDGEPILEKLGRYEIVRRLGEGGMGVVYAAHDPRLDRSVAIKTLRGTTDDPRARERLWREARAAARVSHPNVAQLYEVGDEDGSLYIAMELLEGEPLSARIARGPVPVDEAVPIVLSILSALESLHAQGIVHRDLKPSNVFLTPLGVKLLDFGLARDVDRGGDLAITQTGVLLGTPRYMAPEQWRGDPPGPRSDLFAVGALLYELVSGRPAFTGDTLVQVYDSIASREPPPLGGSSAAAAIDRIVQRALRKNPAERFASAGEMAEALRAATSSDRTADTFTPRALMRLVVLPLRILRPDPETDFLSFSLPDALSGSLSGIESLIVRASVTASRYAGQTPSLEEVAAQAGVDLVLAGTLLRAGDQVRVQAQLVEVPAGTVAWSQTFQAPVGDAFQLQDALRTRIVESLAVPLTAHDRAALRKDIPANAEAYEFYLRANQIAYEAGQLTVARDLYRRCLELDPAYAPAWARLGRVYRAISNQLPEESAANYTRAQEAFARALELNPDLSIAHNLYTYLEVESGRGLEAMRRLLGRARASQHDADLFAGLVQACRYVGLAHASIAAYERASRLDPQIRTSVNHAYLMVGDYQRSIDTCIEDPPFIKILALDLAGRTDEAIALTEATLARRLPPLYVDLFGWTRAILEERPERHAIMARVVPGWTDRDPCGTYYLARHVARSGEPAQALEFLARAVDGGFNCHDLLLRDPWLEGVRGEPEFQALVARAADRLGEGRAAFAEAKGERVLGLA